MLTDEQLSKFRTEFEGTMMYSAIWEYCPREFGLLLDEVTTLRTQLDEARARIEKLEKVREAAKKLADWIYKYSDSEPAEVYDVDEAIDACEEKESTT